MVDEAVIEHLEHNFKALSGKNRLLILSTVADGEVCACDVLDGLKITQPTLSHHLKILHDCKLVHARKNGYIILLTKKI